MFNIRYMKIEDGSNHSCTRNGIVANVHKGLEETGNLLTLKTQQESNDLRRRRKVSHHELQIVSSGRVRCPNNVAKKPWALCNFVRSDFKECSTPNQYDPTCGGDLCCFDGCTYSCLRVEGQDYDEKRREKFLYAKLFLNIF